MTTTVSHTDRRFIRLTGTTLLALAPVLAEGSHAAAQKPNEPIRQQSYETAVASGGAARAATPRRDQRVPIAKTNEERLRISSGPPAEKRAARGSGTIAGAVGSLGVVVGLFLLVVWVMKRNLPAATRRLPSEVVAVLGHVPLAHRQQAQLLRFGGKLVLISTSAGGAEPLSEVTDPAEVARLEELCRQANPPAAPITFRHMLDQIRRPQGGAKIAGRGPSATPLAKPKSEVGHG